MKKILSILLVLFLLTVYATPVFATPEQAYQDYLYQFNLYRQKDTAFETARDQYKQFQTLTSQTTAIAAAREMMSQRDLLYRAYLLYLRENLLTNSGITLEQQLTYLGLLKEDIAFFESHYLSILSVQTIGDATKASLTLEDRSLTLNTHMYRIISTLALGRLAAFGKFFDTYIDTSSMLLGAHVTQLTLEKKALINQWLTQITAKRTEFSQNVSDVQRLIDQVTASDTNALQQQYTDVTQKINEAAIPLREGVAYLQELITAVKYVN